MSAPAVPSVDAAYAPTTDAGTGGQLDDADRRGTTDGRYTLQRELARGGMGQIWIADDAKLSRRVAIKELLESGGSRGVRFARELALTARLEHPAIVGIHDGGTWPDGKQFYVMKFVAGTSLDHMIARAADVAERMALLPHGLAVVDALAYAHAQGIVHRDLKPENILVGDFGETVVIDWGLAKDLRATTPELIDGPYRSPAAGDATIGGEVMGTPAYMPPEQALGDAVDERADVYSLGAVLYHLLSGTRPHQGTSVEDVLVSVITRPPPPLASVVPGLPTDLITIVEKAMARDADDRYATARELAVDLKQFLRGQLVGAHRYTGGQLLRRWLRRHRTAVAVASLAVVALVALSGLSFRRIVREERHAQEARRLAERNGAAAEKHHAKAEGLLTFMLVELRARLAPIGKLDLLESVALEAREYFRDQTEAGTPEEQHQRALAHHGLGEVLDAKGHSAEALAEHQAALAIHTRLASTDVRWQRELAASSVLTADALRTRGQGDAALEGYRRAVAIDQRLVSDKPDDTRALDALAGAHASLGDFVFHERRDTAAALVEQRASLALHQRLIKLEPTAAGRGRALASAHGRVADMQMHLGDLPASTAGHREALAIVEAVAASDPADTISQELLADRIEELGGVLHNQDDLAGALENYKKTLVVRERLLAKDPTNARWRTSFARTHMNIGQALDQQRDLPGSIQHHRTALDQIEGLLREDATNLRLRGTQAFLQRLIASVLHRQRHLDEAIAAFDSSRTTTEKLAVDEPANERWQTDLAYLYADLAAVRGDRGDLVIALELKRKALAVSDRIAVKNPSNVSAQSDLADAHAGLAEALVRTGDLEGARASYGRALEISEALAAKDSRPGFSERVAELHKRIASCCTGRAKP